MVSPDHALWIRDHDGHLSFVTREALAAVDETPPLNANNLIVGLRPSSKLQKAQKPGIPVLTEDILLSRPSSN